MYSIYNDMRRRSRVEAHGREALMAVPRSSAPVFGRYAGVQGVQMCRSAARRGFRPVFPLGRGCVGAPPDVGLGLFFQDTPRF